MIRIFTSPSCSSCRKVKAWFDEQKIPYEAVNIFGDDFTKDDIRELIAKSENGTDDIISPRSKIVQENHINFDDMKGTASRRTQASLSAPSSWTIGASKSATTKTESAPSFPRRGATRRGSARNVGAASIGCARPRRIPK